MVFRFLNECCKVSTTKQRCIWPFLPLHFFHINGPVLHVYVESIFVYNAFAENLFENKEGGELEKQYFCYNELFP